MSRRTVVAVRDNGREKVIGGPYPPAKAREIKRAFQRDVENDRPNRDLPSDTDRIEMRPSEKTEEVSE